MRLKSLYSGRRRDRKREKRRRILMIRAFLASCKDVPCAECKLKLPVECMHFDHISNNKSFTVSTKKQTFSIPRLKAEIDKCEVVCANCHAIRTKRRGYTVYHKTPPPPDPQMIFNFF